jgi:hypothetical protein
MVIEHPWKKTEDEIVISNKWNPGSFICSRPLLQEILKQVSKAEGKCSQLETWIYRKDREHY